MGGVITQYVDAEHTKKLCLQVVHIYRYVVLLYCIRLNSCTPVAAIRGPTLVSYTENAIDKLAMPTSSHGMFVSIQNKKYRFIAQMPVYV